MFDIEKRFCKDENLSIKLFQQPYFTERLELFGKYEEFMAYLSMIEEEFNGYEGDYLAYYNRVKDSVIDYIKNSEAFQRLNSDDMSKYSTTHSLPQRDVYKEFNIGHKFVSIDLAKANFSALVHYGVANDCPFFESYNYDDFMRKFTKNEHIIKSKYIRQVVFGNCNPKRQTKYESFLMEGLVSLLCSLLLIKYETDIYSLNTDEVIINVDNYTDNDISALRKFIDTFSKKNYPLHFTYFTLGKVLNSDAYIKKFDDESVELKCVCPEEAPYLYRLLKGEEPTENDSVFEYRGQLAKFLDVPKYEITYKELK